MPATETAPNIFPALSYRDAKNAIDWLCRAFGFEQLAVYEGPNGSVAHAELRLRPGVIMLGSTKENHFGLAPPTDGKVTQVTYIAVEDPDAHCARPNRGCGDRRAARRYGIWVARIHCPRSGRSCLELRHISAKA